jgi:hypothetical protein
MIYLAPMKKWVVDELESREKNPNMSNTKMSFVIMTSAAKIVKHTTQQTREAVLNSVKEVVEGKGVVEHLGCIISNHIDPNINYSQANPYIGYDFNGKLITVNGESGRKIPPPIIESVDINTNGVGNTLKEAVVNVRCFSLKQYEMFELFFCKPAMHILLEFGDNSNSRVLSDVMIEKTKYSDFVTQFRKFTNPTTKHFAEYLEKCRISNGSYDNVAGKLINYSYSIDNDSTYNVQLTIAQSNEYSLALPKAFVTNYSAVSTPNNKNLDTFEEWQNQIINDLPGLNVDYIKSLKKDVWKKDFFNWGKSDETDIEKSASNDPYISLRFLLDILLNNIASQGGIDPDFKFEYSHRFNKNGEKIIPFNVHKNIISSSPSIIFPNKELPKFNLNTKTNKIEIDTKTIDGSINGYSLFDNTSFDYIDPRDKKITITQSKTETRIGNALNIFIRYKDVGELWEKNYSRKAFLVDILDKINEASYGTFRLIYANINEGDKASVIDSKLYVAELTSSKLNEQSSFRKEYRFKPTTMNSNVREFNFNFELTNQVAAATVFNMNKYLAGLKNKTTADKIPLPNEAYQSIDYSSFSTADGLYSINQIEYEQLMESTKATPPNPKIKEDTSTEAKIAERAYNLKQIKFKIKKGDVRTFIYLDYAFILDYLKLTGKDGRLAKNTYELVTPITINVKIDGISGITCGETFKIDGIPEQYNRLGDFQITNTKHNVDKDNGWTTTLEAMFMYGS